MSSPALPCLVSPNAQTTDGFADPGKGPGCAPDIVAEIEDPSHLFKVTVEAKSLLKFLATYQVASSAIACTFVRVLLSLAEPEWILTRTEGMCGEDTGLCSDHCAIFYVYIGQSKDRVEGGVLTFFVPAVKLDGDDDV